jgi:hypothetical protein
MDKKPKVLIFNLIFWTQVLMLILKLLFIKLSWWIILIPILLPIAIFIAITLCFGFIFFYDFLIEN